MMCFNFHVHFVFILLIQTVEKLGVEKHIESVILSQNHLVCLEITYGLAVFTAIDQVDPMIVLGFLQKIINFEANFKENQLLVGEELLI